MFFDHNQAFYAPLSPCRPPSQQELNRLRFDAHNGLFAGRVHHNAGSVYDLNWLNILDVRANWHLFDADPEKQHALRAIVKSAWSGNTHQRGLKHECPLVDHCLLMALANGVNLLPRYGYRLIYSCLKDPETGNYSPDKVNLRVLNPHSAVSEADDFLRHHSLEGLFKTLPARILLFDPTDPELDRVGASADCNADVRRRQFKAFFDSVTSHLDDLIKRHTIFNYFASCEISCKSIRGSLFHPHLHAVVWMEPGTSVEWLEHNLPEGVRLLRPGGLLTSYQSVVDFVRYLFQVNSIAEAYKREWSEDGIREFNISTVNAWETMLRLVTGDAGSRAYKRIRYRYLPGRERNFVHRKYDRYKKGQARRRQQAARRRAAK